MAKKIRLDQMLVSRGLCESRTRARALVMAGGVVVDDHRVDKPGTRVSDDCSIRLKRNAGEPYVSRGGRKLQAGLDAFGVDPTGRVALDIGASTGGFTDCLLQKGAQAVFAVDVGYGQLHNRLRSDRRVINLERINARKLTREELGPQELADRIDLVVTDASFISLRHLLPPLPPLLPPHGEIVALVKPQFEVGLSRLPRGGVVRDDGLRRQAADDVAQAAKELGFREAGRIDSPVPGPRGNIEILLYLVCEQKR